MKLKKNPNRANTLGAFGGSHWHRNQRQLAHNRACSPTEPITPSIPDPLGHPFLAMIVAALATISGALAMLIAL